MKILKFNLLLFISLLLGACGNSEQTIDGKNTDTVSIKKTKQLSREEYIEQIKKTEAELFQSTEIDRDKGAKAVKLYALYAMLFPTDTISAHFLFKAGEIATATKEYNEALSYYETIEKNYPNFVHKDAALYLQAYVYDYLINDDQKAKMVYERLATKYPKSIYSNDVQAALNNLGKSDEELIKEFEKKNKQK